MSTSKEFRDFILDKLKLCENIFCRSMMGEYLLYSNNILFGGIYDERLLFKKTDTNLCFNMQEVIPYPGAKPMFMCADVQDEKLIKEIVLKTCKGLIKK